MRQRLAQSKQKGIAATLTGIKGTHRNIDSQIPTVLAVSRNRDAISVETQSCPSFKQVDLDILARQAMRCDEPRHPRAHNGNLEPAMLPPLGPIVAHHRFHHEPTTRERVGWALVETEMSRF